MLASFRHPTPTLGKMNMKTWEKPSYQEVRMNAEIGAYQGDPDFAPACLESEAARTSSVAGMVEAEQDQPAA